MKLKSASRRIALYIDGHIVFVEEGCLDVIKVGIMTVKDSDATLSLSQSTSTMFGGKLASGRFLNPSSNLT